MGRIRLPDTRDSITHKFSIAGHEGYITAGMYPDGKLGELFITIAKEGSTISGLMDAIATITSIALQHGVPLEVIVDKMKFTRFEPYGYTGNADIPSATSVIDYVAKWLALKFLPPVKSDSEEVFNHTANGIPSGLKLSASAPPCTICGGLTQRAGACYVCATCGESSGCG